jgi:hypothetical protein
LHANLRCHPVVVLGGISPSADAAACSASCRLRADRHAAQRLHHHGRIPRQNIIRGVVLLLAIIVDNWLHPRDEETARQGD